MGEGRGEKSYLARSTDGDVVVNLNRQIHYRVGSHLSHSNVRKGKHSLGIF